MPTKFVFLVLPQVHLLDLAGPDQVISESIDFGASFEIVYCGIEKNIQTSAGLGINKLVHFSDVKLTSKDFVIIAGARIKYIQSKDLKLNFDLFKWLQLAHSNKVTLISICVGAFVLAEAGLLNKVKCTTHFQMTESLQNKFPKAIVKHNVLFCFDNNIYTSAGIISGIDLMLHLVEQLKDSYFASKVARELVMYKRRSAESEQESIYFQYRNHIHSGIHKAQDYIIENISKKIYLSKLAEDAAMSERNFTRLFKKESGLTVNEYITNIRVEKMKLLLSNPDLSRIQIANKIGLNSIKQMERLYKKHIG